MSRWRYFDGAASADPLTARPRRSAVRSQADFGSSLQRRIEAGPGRGAAARPVSRSRCMAGHQRSNSMPARSVTPPTIAKDRAPTVMGFMVASHLDLGDAPDQKEADRLENEPGSHEPRTDRIGAERVEVAGVKQLEQDREDRGAQPDADRGPAMLRGEHPGIAQDLEALADDLGQAVQDLGQVAADPALDGDGGAEEAHVLDGDPRLESEQGVAGVHPEPDLLVDPAELLADWVGHVLTHDAEGAREGVAGPDRAGDGIEGVG